MSNTTSAANDNHWGLFAVTAPEEGETKRGKYPARLGDIRHPQSPTAAFNNALSDVKKSRDHWQDKLLVEDLVDEHGREIVSVELGYNPRPGGKMILMDLDNAVDEAGDVRDWAQEIIGDFDGWVELSTSGTGLRVVMKRGGGDELQSSAEKNDVGLFANGGRAAIITGNVLDGYRKKLKRDAGVIERLLARRGELKGRDGASDDDRGFLGDRWILTAEEMAECLLSIPNRGIEREGGEAGTLTWIGVLAALKRTYGEELWAAFDEWTAGSEDHGYDPVQNRVRWDQDSIAGGGGATPEHIIRFALAGGWWTLPERLEEAAGARGECLSDDPSTDAEVLARFAQVKIGGGFYDYLYRELVPNRDTLLGRTRDAPMASMSEGEKPKIVLAGRVAEKRYAWLRHELPAINEVVWYPGEPEKIEGRRLVSGEWQDAPGWVSANTWVAPVGGGGRREDAGPWLDHVKSLYPAEWQEIVAVLAWQVQRPGVKLNWAMVLCGGQGIGKDLMLQPLGRILGRAFNGGLNYGRWVEEGWDNGLHERTFIVLQEAQGSANGKKVANRLKPFIASPPHMLSLNIKGQKLLEVPNVANWAITTNFSDAIYIAPDDRRYAVAISPVAAADQPERYGEKLAGWIEGGGWKDVGALLSRWDLSGLGRTPPPWAGTEQMREDSRSPLAVAVEDVVGEARFVCLRHVVDALGSRASSQSVAAVLREDFGWSPVLNAVGKRKRWGAQADVMYARENGTYPEKRAVSIILSGSNLRQVPGDFDVE